MSTKPGLQNLSPEVLCHIAQYLPLKSILRLSMLCKSLNIGMNMHLRLCKSIDFCPDEIYSYMPSSITDEHIDPLFKKCPQLESVYGLCPKTIDRRRLRNKSTLTVPGIIHSLLFCLKLKLIETNNLKLLEALVLILPHVEIKCCFYNRDFAFSHLTCHKLRLQPRPYITTLYLTGVELPELTTLPFLVHCHLKHVRFTKPQPFRPFLAQGLKTFVMRDCMGPQSPIRYFPLILALSAAPNLQRLELVRVPLPAGLFQRAVEDSFRTNGFRNLTELLIAGCKGILETDLGHLMIVAQRSLQVLSIQPSLTRDSLFVSLSFAHLNFQNLKSLNLGYVEKLEINGEEVNNETLQTYGLSDVPDTPSSLTDSGMKIVGRIFPCLRQLNVSNCPHLISMSQWGTSWRELVVLTLQKCHCLQIASFRPFVMDRLPKIEVLILNDMFREPPKGCSHVGLSAGTGLGMSSAVVSNQDEHIAVQGHQQNFDLHPEDLIDPDEIDDLDPENPNQHIRVLQQDFFDDDHPIVPVVPPVEPVAEEPNAADAPNEDQDAELLPELPVENVDRNPEIPEQQIDVMADGPLPAANANVVEADGEESEVEIILDDVDKTGYLAIEDNDKRLNIPQVRSWIPNPLCGKLCFGPYDPNLPSTSQQGLCYCGLKTTKSIPLDSSDVDSCENADAVKRKKSSKNSAKRSKIIKKKDLGNKASTVTNSDSTPCTESITVKKEPDELENKNASTREIRLKVHFKRMPLTDTVKEEPKAVDDCVPNIKLESCFEQEDILNHNDDSLPKVIPLIKLDCSDEESTLNKDKHEESKSNNNEKVKNDDVKKNETKSVVRRRRKRKRKLNAKSKESVKKPQTEKPLPKKKKPDVAPIASCSGIQTRSSAKALITPSPVEQKSSKPEPSKRATRSKFEPGPSKTDNQTSEAKAGPSKEPTPNACPKCLAVKAKAEDAVSSDRKPEVVNHQICKNHHTSKKFGPRRFYYTRSQRKRFLQEVDKVVSQGTQASSADIRRAIRRHKMQPKPKPKRKATVQVKSKVIRVSSRQTIRRLKRKKEAVEMISRGTSTSDPLLEDDALQVMIIESATLISLTVRSCGVSTINVSNCPKITHIEAQGCRILKIFKTSSCYLLSRLSISQCPKFHIRSLYLDTFWRSHPSDLLISYEPCSESYSIIDAEHDIFDYIQDDVRVTVCHDVNHGCERRQAAFKENLLEWFRVLRARCSKMKEHREYFPGQVLHNKRRMHGTYPSGVFWNRSPGIFEIVTNDAFFADCLPSSTLVAGLQPPNLNNRPELRNFLCPDLQNMVGFYISLNEKYL